jgi:hypothetical protein
LSGNTGCAWIALRTAFGGGFLSAAPAALPICYRTY